MWPFSSTAMLSAAGTRGRPGMVMIAPQITTTNSAPPESRTSRIGTSKPLGAFLSAASAEKLYCVFAMHTGKCPKPPAWSSSSRRLTVASAVMPSAP